MGERQGGDGPFGCRRAHPGGPLFAPGRAYADQADADRADSRFEARLGAALRTRGVDAEAERRAVAAFRAAHATQASRARTRRRDDWRPAAPRRARVSLKATLSVVLASLTLGGVAFAAIGSAGSGTHARPGTSLPVHQPASTPHRPSAAGTSAGTVHPPSGIPSARPHHPDTARDTVAHCRTYERAGNRGGALDATAWQRLVSAAGGEDKVAAYCAAQMKAAEGKRDDNGGNSATNGGNSGRKAPGKK
ncbi:hypothetical protein ACFV2N_11455 [Streptomyces sp. NPDC059680]|uniref:hypothetical protein n=1 Tax=Streptomyces sp. NPDC059680 TaxID=3346904 RepID=UPI00369F7D9D